jgi:hypothetical protein
MTRYLLRPEEHAHHVVVGAHEHTLTIEAPGHRVLNPVEADRVGAAHARRGDVVGVERDLAQRQERVPLDVLDQERRHLAGALVLARVREGVAPGDRVALQRREVREAAPAS